MRFFLEVPTAMSLDILVDKVQTASKNGERHNVHEIYLLFSCYGVDLVTGTLFWKQKSYILVLFKEKGFVG